ncbi:hypothetical protein K439DRAFT_1623710 [Ramaria rubella]|nr:hypothetical protein K439DRAFT_1623710 [Ramaria rubella]
MSKHKRHDETIRENHLRTSTSAATSSAILYVAMAQDESNGNKNMGLIALPRNKLCQGTKSQHVRVRASHVVPTLPSPRASELATKRTILRYCFLKLHMLDAVVAYPLVRCTREEGHADSLCNMAVIAGHNVRIDWPIILVQKYSLNHSTTIITLIYVSR